MATTPSLRRRRLSAALRKLREDAGLDTRGAAERSGFSQTKISNMEGLKVGITGDDAHTLCTAYGADNVTTEALVQLARDARKRGWWHVYSDDALGEFSGFVELEEDAISVHEFESDVIPGQMQTEAYATAVIGRLAPEVDTETVKQRVALRMERQSRVLKQGTDLWLIIGEGALRQATGGHGVMAEQLEHLERMSGQPGVTVQVLPASNLGHPAMGVPFTLITLRDGTQYIYQESIPGGLYMEDPSGIRLYSLAWSRLQATALDLDRSVRMIGRIGREHRSSTDDD